jgi:glucose/arabinose dehydrogenase
MVVDLAFSPDGMLYVLQHASSPALVGGPGRLIRVAADGTRTTIDTGGALTQPVGLAVGPDGALYVSNKSVLVGQGEVLRIAP